MAMAVDVRTMRSVTETTIDRTKPPHMQVFLPARAMRAVRAVFRGGSSRWVSLPGAYPSGYRRGGLGPNVLRSHPRLAYGFRQQ